MKRALCPKRLVITGCLLLVWWLASWYLTTDAHLLRCVEPELVCLTHDHYPCEHLQIVVTGNGVGNWVYVDRSNARIYRRDGGKAIIKPWQLLSVWRRDEDRGLRRLNVPEIRARETICAKVIVIEADGSDLVKKHLNDEGIKNLMVKAKP